MRRGRGRKEGDTLPSFLLESAAAVEGHLLPVFLFRPLLSLYTLSLILPPKVSKSWTTKSERASSLNGRESSSADFLAFLPSLFHHSAPLPTVDHAPQAMIPTTTILPTNQLHRLLPPQRPTSSSLNQPTQKGIEPISPPSLPPSHLSTKRNEQSRASSTNEQHQKGFSETIHRWAKKREAEGARN